MDCFLHCLNIFYSFRSNRLKHAKVLKLEHKKASKTVLKDTCKEIDIPTNNLEEELVRNEEKTIEEIVHRIKEKRKNFFYVMDLLFTLV